MVPVAAVEFDEGGNTIWVQSEGGTVLRVKCSGRIRVKESCTNIVPHADMNVMGDIEICLPEGGE